MTFSINGCGTRLCGARQVTSDEFDIIMETENIEEIIQSLPIQKEEDVYRFGVATKAFCLLWIPLIPLETFVYYYPRTGFFESEKYIPLFDFNHTARVNWSHVKQSRSFYIAPIIFIIIIFYYIFMRMHLL